jgi:hypothetical protein
MVLTLACRLADSDGVDHVGSIDSHADTWQMPQRQAAPSRTCRDWWAW